MSLSASRYICEVKLHVSHKRVNIKVYAGLFRPQVKYKLYQAFWENPKMHMGGSAEVSMVSKPVNNSARRYDYQVERKSKTGQSQAVCPA